MKTLISLFSALILTGFSVNAGTKTSSTLNAGYQNSFIFVENGIEFSVFRDGQFDFNLLNNNPHFSASINTPNVSISFNNGYDYTPHLQFDEFGAIIQVENTPIFYDYYGRVNQVGGINIIYNNFGYISRLGGLHVHYNRFNRYSHYTGFINIYNRGYVYRPWHNYYMAPPVNYCVVYNRPYRQFYTPVRYAYSSPFYNNYRPVTSVYSRQGNVVARNRSYATAYRSSNHMNRVHNDADIRKSTAYNKPNKNNYNGSINRSTRLDYNNGARQTNNNISRNATRSDFNTARNPSSSTRNIQSHVNRERNANVVQNQTRSTQQPSFNRGIKNNNKDTDVKYRNNSGNSSQSASIRRRF